MSAQLSLFEARRRRDTQLQRITRVVSPAWLDSARRFIVAYLTQHGPTAGEDITDAAEKFGGLEPQGGGDDGRRYGWRGETDAERRGAFSR